MRIGERIRAAISSGALAVNPRLPSSRTLPRDLCVARNTVDEAIGQLVADGLIVRRRAACSFVSDRLPNANAPPAAPQGEEEARGTAERISNGAKTMERD